MGVVAHLKTVLAQCSGRRHVVLCCVTVIARERSIVGIVSRVTSRNHFRYLNCTSNYLRFSVAFLVSKTIKSNQLQPT